MFQVALKTLIVIHRALREVDPTFREELINFGRSRSHMLNLSHFKDDSSPNGNKYTVSYLYLKYLIQKWFSTIWFQLGIILLGYEPMHCSWRRDLSVFVFWNMILRQKDWWEVVFFMFILIPCITFVVFSCSIMYIGFVKIIKFPSFHQLKTILYLVRSNFCLDIMNLRYDDRKKLILFYCLSATEN